MTFGLTFFCRDLGDAISFKLPSDGPIGLVNLLFNIKEMVYPFYIGVLPPTRGYAEAFSSALHDNFRLSIGFRLLALSWKVILFCSSFMNSPMPVVPFLFMDSP